MRRLAVIVASVTMTAAGIAVTSTSGRAAPSCGVERWSVKTLQDPAGKSLNLTQVTKTTVNALRT
jgi:hypothetical protein